MKHMFALLLLTLPTLPLPVLADIPEIAAVRVEGQTIHVTLAHPDTGWDHYADGWEVVTGDGTSLGLRVLAHPHVDEQPFTRSLRLDAALPDGAGLRAGAVQRRRLGRNIGAGRPVAA